MQGNKLPVLLQIQRQSGLPIYKTEKVSKTHGELPAHIKKLKAMNLTELHEYQKRLANFIAKHPNAIISVDMGLGKTAATLAWLDWFARRRNYNVRGIIIAPKRVAENNWLHEAENL